MFAHVGECLFTSSNIASYYLCIHKVYESNVNKEATNIITNEGKNKKKLCFAFSQKFRFFNKNSG